MRNYIDFIFEKKSPDVDKKLIDQYGEIKVYSVNGAKIRNINKSHEEFGLSSVHGCFPSLIPKNEIWIESNVKKNEIPYLIYSALYQIRLTEDGMKPWDAYKKGVSYEKKLRNKNIGKKYNGTKKIHKKEWFKNSDITIWLIDAEKVRDYYKTDFMEGGHGYVYDWIPKDEIWIENGINEKEIPLIVLHEYIERELMKIRKMNYDKAHDIAARIEYNHRPYKFTKNDFENITPDKALKMVDDIKKT